MEIEEERLPHESVAASKTLAAGLSPKKKLVFCTIIIGFVTCTTLVVAEIAMRWMGYPLYRPREAQIVVRPGGRFFRSDPLVGFGQLPGEFDITLRGEFTFHVTHLADGFRVTRPSDVHQGNEAVWVLGCSFTHGWSVNDEQTYPWLVQESLSNVDVKNFGVEGYSNVQSLIQLKKAFAECDRNPRLVVVTYASFHDERNVFLRARAKQIRTWKGLGPVTPPYAALQNEKLVIEYSPLAYDEFPLMRHSVIVNELERRYCIWEARRKRSHRVTKAVMRELKSLCDDRGIALVVAGITSDATTSEMLQYCSKCGIRTVDISVDLSRPGMTNQPYDAHPSAQAHRIYADKLLAYLDSPDLADLW